MHLPFHIAKRYLFAKKSHNVINIISAVSATGIGLGCMALIIILSVYNGFNTLIKTLYESYQPEFIITPAKGKSFIVDSSTINILKEIDNRLVACPLIEENVFATYGGNEAIANIRGVDSSFLRLSGLSGYLIEGEFSTGIGDISGAIVSMNLASELGIRTRFVEPIELFFPDKNSDISITDPFSSLLNVSFYPTGILNIDKNYDNNSIIVPISKAAELTGRTPEEITSLYIYIDSTNTVGTISHTAVDTRKHSSNSTHQTVITSISNKIKNSQLQKKIATKLGKEFIVKDRFMQNETLYKMMHSEKFAVYTILLFVIIIVSFNIYGSLSMLIIEKKDDIGILKSMGANDKLINKIFIIQGILISALGAFSGVIIGTLLSLLQARFHIVPMPGNFIIDYYPVEVQISDIILTLSGVLIIGYILAVLPVSLFRKKI